MIEHEKQEAIAGAVRDAWLQEAKMFSRAGVSVMKSAAGRRVWAHLRNMTLGAGRKIDMEIEDAAFAADAKAADANADNAQEPDPAPTPPQSDKKICRLWQRVFTDKEAPSLLKPLVEEDWKGDRFYMYTMSCGRYFMLDIHDAHILIPLGAPARVEG